MRIGGGGSTDINLLQSDAAQYRNQDFVVSQALAFSGAVTPAAEAAKFQHIQLKNPAASGIIALIDRIYFSVAAASQVRIGLYDTDLATDTGNWNNLLAGGSAGLCELRTENLDATVGTYLWSARILADTPIPVVLPFPIILGAGNGLIGQIVTVNVSGFVAFTGREI